MERTLSLACKNMLDIAGQTGVFNAADLLILQEVIIDQENDPAKGYRLVTIGQAPEIEGFAIFGQTPLTSNTWDIYWIAVDVALHGRGIGCALLEQVEAEIMKCTELAGVIRVETSSRDSYAPARALYARQGYGQVGFIEDFYKPGDSLVTFARKMIR